MTLFFLETYETSTLLGTGVKSSLYHVYCNSLFISNYSQNLLGSYQCPSLFYVFYILCAHKRE